MTIWGIRPSGWKGYPANINEAKEHHNHAASSHFQRGDRLYTSESDVCRRQILTYKDDPHTERIKTFIMAVNP